MSLGSVATAFGLASLYVGSLYVWRSPASRDRDHPSTIRRRFISALFNVTVSPAVVYCYCVWNTSGSDGAAPKGQQLLQLLGLRLEGLVTALTVPVVLTAVLFTGPIAVSIFGRRTPMAFKMNHLWHSIKSDLVFWRNYVVAPISEELTFRACVLPVLLKGGASPLRAALISPLLFGMAHLHHLMERVRMGQPLASAVAISLFQMTYTTVFGLYASFLFLRTGHLTACIAAHCLCNFLGFPDILEVFHQPPVKRMAFSVLYVLGAVAFAKFLHPATAPELYLNSWEWSKI